MKFSQKVRDLIHHRAAGRCEICGMPCIGGQIHHRRPRGMGGTSRKETGTASNGLYVHLKCHANVESSRTAALENGWLVSQNSEPADVPVRLYYGRVLLSDDGSANQMSEIEERINSSGD